MRVEAIDAPTAPDDLLLELAALELRATAELAPGEERQSPRELVAYYRHVPAGQPRPRWIARVDGEAVGLATLYVHAPRHVYAQIAIAPDRRREGIGSALLDTLLAEARRLGADSLYGHYAGEAGAAFAAKAGAVADQRDVRSILRLAEVDLPAPTVPEGYELRSWRGAAPEELVAAYADTRNSMADTPLPPGQVPTEWTVAMVRDYEQTAERRGREVRVTVAVDSHAAIASFTDLRLSSAGVQSAFVDATGTVAALRRRGLATGVKLESLRLLREERPAVEAVVTLNAERNAPMRRINERLGFVPTVTMTTAVLTL